MKLFSKTLHFVESEKNYISLVKPLCHEDTEHKKDATKRPCLVTCAECKKVLKNLGFDMKSCLAIEFEELSIDELGKMD